MTEKTIPQAFSETERATLHSVAEMLGDRDDRDQLRQIIQSGATIKDLVFAYKYQKTTWRIVKWAASSMAILAAGAAAITQLSGKG